MSISVADVTAHHASTTASRNAKEKKQLTNEVSKVLDRAITVANSSHLPFDERLSAIKAMSSPSTAPAAAPAALPSSPGKSQEQLALETLASSSDPRITEGIKNLIQRVFSNTTDPTHISVEKDGTPTELASLRADHKRTSDELANERDKSVNGSLAHQLEEAKAKPSASAPPTGSPLSNESVSHLKAVRDAVANLAPKATSFRGNTYSVTQKLKDDLVQQLDAVIHEVEPTTGPTPPPSTP